MRSVVVHYQELALKGRNRPWFVKQLVGNLRTVVRGLDVTAVKVLMGRLEIVLGPAIEWPEFEARLARIFGVANFSRAGRVPVPGVSPEALDAIADAILRDLPPEDVDSFRVLARRADKRVPMTSPDIEREVGGRIKMARGWRVDLTRPALTIHLEILTAEAFY
jgi:thiamine biosynthesis protein ThiI